VEQAKMLQQIKKVVSNVPIVGIALKRLYRSLRGKTGIAFQSSYQYWDERYRMGGNSGAGSYKRLARFKAEVLNEFVRDHSIKTIIELGCGDGAQLGLAEYPNYVGVDVSPWAVKKCRSIFRGDARKRFFLSTEIPTNQKAELALSLDVIYHLVEDKIFDAYMHQLFQVAERYVILYSSNDDKKLSVPHVRHRAFSQWVDHYCPEWELGAVIKNRYPHDPDDPENTSFADFFIYQKRRGCIPAE
jgi:hypothetical protein